MKIYFTIISLCIFLQIGNSQILKKTDFSIGDQIEIKSEILQENRTINVYLPSGYHPDSLRTYPVIYLLDGSKDEDFIHISGLVQFCSFSWIDIMPEAIVVGIANVDRKRDFTYPSKNERDLKEFPTTGSSAPFIKFIAEELQGLIDENYNTDGTKTLMGQSLGGLLATEILLKHPAMFDNFVIISPSLWWDDESLLSHDLDKSLAGKQVYIGVGKEGPYMERVAKTLYSRLSVEKSKELKLYFDFYEELDHGDVLHKAAYRAFEKIFEKEEGK